MDIGTSIAFYILAALTTISSLMVVSLRNLFHAVLFLILAFAGVAGLYITLSAEFVAAVQILIYAGAISVLMIFGIMLTSNAMTQGNPPGRFQASALVAGVLFFVTVAYVALKTPWGPVTQGTPSYSVEAIADSMFNTYALPFEVASVLLLVAMIGAIVLARD